MQYVGSAFIGKQKQEMKFIYDTGSTWLWVPRKGCIGCPSTNFFDLSQSQILNKTESLMYGQGQVNGTHFLDEVRLCVECSPVQGKMLAVDGGADLEGT